jgi:hypothetical protein
MKPKKSLFVASRVNLGDNNGDMAISIAIEAPA